MHSNQNVRLTNKNQMTGNVANYFDNLSKLIQTNDGTRSFSLRTVDCHDQAAPFTSSQETRIAITHSDHQISQITDGFLTFHVRTTLQLLGIDPNFEDRASSSCASISSRTTSRIPIIPLIRFSPVTEVSTGFITLF